MIALRSHSKTIIQPTQRVGGRRGLAQKSKLLAAMAATSLMLAGCVTDPNGYNNSSVGVPSEIIAGRLVGIEPVRINGTNSGVGAVSGAALGGALGSRVGRGGYHGHHRGGNLAAGIGFAILGGLVGAAIEEGATGGNGFRYTVELDDGREISVVQRGQRPIASVGSDVRVEYGRIVRILPS